MAVTADRFYFTMFKNSSASADMNVDGSSSAVDFTVTGVATGNVLVQRLNFLITDGGMGYGEFAGLGVALTNGLEIKAFDGDNTELIDFTDGLNIKINDDFSLLAGVDSFAHPTAGDDFLPVRWTIAKAGTQLELRENDYIRIRVQDDLRDVTKFRVMAQGVKL